LGAERVRPCREKRGFRVDDQKVVVSRDAPQAFWGSVRPRKNTIKRENNLGGKRTKGSAE